MLSTLLTLLSQADAIKFKAIIDLEALNGNNKAIVPEPEPEPIPVQTPNNVGWTSYLKGLGANCMNNSGSAMPEGQSISYYSHGSGSTRTHPYCVDLGMKESDFPTGSLGLTNLGSFYYGEWAGRTKSHNLTNLDFLDGVETVTGALTLNNNQIENVLGLNDLTSISSYLTLENNNITTLRGLENLTSIGGEFNLNGNDIVDFRALENLGSVSGKITLNAFDENKTYKVPTEGAWCDNQVYNRLSDYTLNGYYDLFATSCGVDLSEGLTSNNKGWTEYLRSVDANCFNDSVLTSSHSISKYDYLNYHMHCAEQGMNSNDIPNGNLGLTSLDNFYFGEKLGRTKPNKLDNIDFLDGLTSLTGYMVINNNNLTSLWGLRNVTSIGGELDASDNQLTNMDDLNALTSISGNFFLTGNDILDYSGLENLGYIGGKMYLDTYDSSKTYAFPTSGAWCTNKPYVRLEGQSDLFEEFEKACGWDSTKEVAANNKGWAQYLYGLGQNCFRSNSVVAEGANISHYTSSGVHSFCVTLGMDQPDFPNGSLGVSTLNAFYFGQTNGHSKPGSLDNVDFLDSLRSITNYLNLGENNLLNLHGLRNLTSIGTSLDLLNNSIIDYTGLSNLSSAGVIYVDTPDVGTLWPVNGSWCTNQTYLTLSDATAISQAQTACGN